MMSGLRLARQREIVSLLPENILSTATAEPWKCVRTEPSLKNKKG